jgi:hypothetical protein
MLPGSRFPSKNGYSMVLDKALHATTIKLAGSANPSFLPSSPDLKISLVSSIFDTVQPHPSDVCY